ncbi:MAG: dockerin type I repeat-containing protein [Phycisphaerae bacterium]|nr:dockerin type I repeat-containing protein [Phycisphaerae bacterium]
MRIVATVVAVVVASPAFAQWSTDPAVNTPICTAAGDSVQPKIVSAPDGGTYVSWFDNRVGGYDVYLQRLDADGNAVWPLNGILIADRSLSSTEDYGACSDGQGGVVLAFGDDRFGGVKTTVTRVDPNGVQVWGPNGKQVSTLNVNSPTVALSGDGRIVAAWIEGNATALQRLELDGTMVWAVPVALTAAGAQLWVADLQSGGGTSVIASMVRQTGFAGAKTLRAQKIDASGALLWGAPHVSVFTTGSLQFANFPNFVPDGAGGAVFSFYTTGPLQSFAQRIDSAGNLLFGVNGAGVTTTTTRERTGPAVAFDPTTQRTYVAWEERIPSTSNYGCSAQAFDATGTRLWGANGSVLLPVAANFGVREVEAKVFDCDPTFLFVRDVAFNNGTIFAARMTAGGAPIWAGSPVTVCSTRTGHSRLETAIAANGASLVAVWEDSRNGNQDLYGDALRSDGTLGPAAPVVVGDLNDDGIVDAADLAILLGAWGPALPCSLADLNHDGTVDAADLAILLGAWMR